MHEQSWIKGRLGSIIRNITKQSIQNRHELIYYTTSTSLRSGFLNDGYTFFESVKILDLVETKQSF